MTTTLLSNPERSQALSPEVRDAMGRLSDPTARQRFLAERPELCTPEAIVQLAESVPRIVKDRPAEAESLADCALLLARTLHDAVSLALALRAKANVLHVSGKNKAAVHHHRKAKAFFGKIGDRTQLARTLSAMIQPLILLGEYEQAHTAAEEAREIFQSDGNEWRLARVELNTGNIFDRQDRFQEALACYERAYQHLLPYADRDPEAVAVALHNMAGCQVVLNQFQLASTTYEKARSFAVAHEMPALVHQADYNLAWFHYLRGEYGRAISMLRGTRDSFEDTDRYHFALCHLDLSEIYLELNMSREAEAAAEMAGKTFEQLGMSYETGRSLANLGIAYSQQENSGEALRSFGESRAIFVREKNRAWCSLIDLYQSIALFRARRDSEARLLAVSALQYFSSAALPNKAALCHLLLARLHWRSNRLPSALRECSRALRQLKEVESPGLSCQIFTLMGEIEERLGRPKRAYDAYQRAKELLEQLRSGIRGEELKISFMRDRSEVYEGLVSLCIAGGKDQAREALGYIEQAKSRSLLDLLTGDAGPALTAPEGEGKIACRIRELREELNWYHHKAELEQFHTDQNSASKLQRLRNEASGKERELLRLLREHPAEIGEQEVLRAGVPLPIEQIQSELHASATVLEYFQVRDRFLAVLLSRDHLELVPLGNVERIGNLIRQLRFQMAKLRLGQEYVQTFERVLLDATENHLWELHQELVAPLRSQLRTPHLIVVPHGYLHSLPFHCLFDGQNYLVDNFTVSYAPSASIYFLCNKRTDLRQDSNLVLGVPDPGIPIVEEEVASVAKILSRAELAVGPAATTEFLRCFAPQCRVVHIATHGSFREDQPMFSGIRLADGYLSLYDMYHLKLTADLVTLSGCSTGLNLVSAGDEVLGMVRGLIYAGTRSCLLTLWDVQDSSTAEFMRFFYESFIAGRNKAEAVRDASLKLRKSHRHPYYWAPFVLIGKVFGDP